jgi:outer membrane lipoprotein LolB
LLRRSPNIGDWLRAAALGVLIALAGCATVAPPPPPATEVVEAFHLLGRISVRYGNDGFSGSLDWRHGPDRDEVLILSPLGQGVAQLVRNETGVTLTTSDQQVFRADDAESLTEQVLGWRLPLSGLPHWVQGRPAAGSAAETRRDADGLTDRIVQDGWQVEYAGYKAFAAGTLPSRVFMDSPDLRLKLVIDEWQREP